MVEGKQLNSAPELIDLVQIGDYVDYDASSNGVKTISQSDFESTEGIILSEPLNTSDNFTQGTTSAQWRVFSVDRQTKKIELISVEPTVKTVTLSRANGFLNGEKTLNKVCEIYGSGKGATGARSINLSDIEQYSSYDKTKYEDQYADTGFYNGKRQYNNGTFYTEKYDAQGKVIGYNTSLTDAAIVPVTMTRTAYDFQGNASRYFKYIVTYNMIFTKNDNTAKNVYWLANTSVGLEETGCRFNIMGIDNNDLTNRYLYVSTNGLTGQPASGVVPIVTLENGIQTLGKNTNGVWQLKID